MNPHRHAVSRNRVINLFFRRYPQDGHQHALKTGGDGLWIMSRVGRLPHHQPVGDCDQQPAQNLRIRRGVNLPVALQGRQPGSMRLLRSSFGSFSAFWNDRSICAIRTT